MPPQDKKVRPGVESADVLCPYCRRHTARRWPRENALELAASVAYLYPFRCDACLKRFHTFRWGKRYMRVDRERRAHERIDTSIPVTVIVNGHGLEGVVTSLSLGGCGIALNAPLTVGDVVRLDLATGGDAPLVIDVATVRSLRPPVIGFDFVRILPGNARRLTGLLLRLRESVDARRRTTGRGAPSRRRATALARLLASLGFTAICALALAAASATLTR